MSGWLVDRPNDGRLLGAYREAKRNIIAGDGSWSSQRERESANQENEVGRCLSACLPVCLPDVLLAGDFDLHG